MRKLLIVFSVFLLLFLSDYLVFIAARSTVSTFQGYEEMKHLNQTGNYIANLDPNSDMNMGNIDKSDTQNVYDYLNDNGILYFVMRKDHGVKTVIKKMEGMFKVDVINRDKGFYIVKCVKMKKS